MTPPLTILLAAPRGFCAGVDRAVQIVERALALHGPPIYVRHEIVHNAHVVERLKSLGVVFVETLEDIPRGTQKPVIFSAHGVPKCVPLEARQRNLTYIDATCPLVSKVHRQIEGSYAAGYTIILIGHAGHPEVIGTMGQLPAGVVYVIENIKDVKALPEILGPVAYCTQTTLSVEDTAGIIEALRARFPHIIAPRKEDICYATSNRQAAVKAIAPLCDVLLVIGAANSSNANRLVEVARASGCAKTHLIASVKDIHWQTFGRIKTLGLTAGASAPEILLQDMLDSARMHYTVTLRQITVAREDVHFKVPDSL